MSERYIQRTRFGPQQFPMNCPVKLAAGALLEDTRQPRLVAQLKFTAAKRMVTALSVTLHCQGETETDLLFHYEDLSAAPGQSFGQYTAIVLPSGTTAFHVTVETVTYKDNTQWSRQEAEAQEQARQEAAALREEQRRQAKQEAAEKAAAMKAAAEEKLAQKKADIQRKAEEKQRAKAAESDGAPNAPKGKGKAIAIIAAVLVVVIIAGVILAPKLMKGNQPAAEADPTPEITAEPTPAPTPKPTPTPKPVKTDFNETGDITSVYITRNDQGYYELTPDSFTPYLENATTTCAWMGRDLGDDPLVYLKDSFSFAWLVGMGSEYHGLSGDGTMYPQSSGNLPETVCVFAFDGRNHGKVIGYFLGIPEQYDEDTLRIDMTMCDYELASLHEQELAAFEENHDFLYTYIAPNSDFKALGAQYYLQGYNTCDTGNLEDDNCQAYHLWQEVTYQAKDFARDIDHLESRLENRTSQGRYMFFLLLDKNYAPIGVTWSD